MKPRHADLFATDLDDETLIKYIDRFLIFYVRTADRLQRTSVWLDNLEGGLDYLKQVVIEDSLGIADELEEQMSHIVGTYQCEWKTTIEDAEKLKRFRQFVNSDDDDEQVVFVERIRLGARVRYIQQYGPDKIAVWLDSNKLVVFHSEERVDQLKQAIDLVGQSLDSKTIEKVS